MCGEGVKITIHLVMKCILILISTESKVKLNAVDMVKIKQVFLLYMVK